MSDDVYEKTASIIADKAEVEVSTLTAETELETLDVQSLDLAEIIFELEEAFDVEIEMNAANAFAELRTVGDVCTAVRKLANS